MRYLRQPSAHACSRESDCIVFEAASGKSAGARAGWAARTGGGDGTDDGSGGLDPLDPFVPKVLTALREGVRPSQPFAVASAALEACAWMGLYRLVRQRLNQDAPLLVAQGAAPS